MWLGQGWTVEAIPMRPSHPFCRLWPSPLSAVPWLSQPWWLEQRTGPSPQHRGVSKLLRTCLREPWSNQRRGGEPRPRQAALPHWAALGRACHRPGMRLSEQLASPAQRWDSQGCLAANSFCASLSQAGGLMPVVPPTWMECTTHRGRTQISSTVAGNYWYSSHYPRPPTDDPSSRFLNCGTHWGTMSCPVSRDLLPKQ